MGLQVRMPLNLYRFRLGSYRSEQVCAPAGGVRPKRGTHANPGHGNRIGNKLSLLCTVAQICDLLEDQIVITHI